MLHPEDCHSRRNENGGKHLKVIIKMSGQVVINCPGYSGFGKMRELRGFLSWLCVVLKGL